MKLLLASQSAARRRMLEAAGVSFETVSAALDEEEAKAGLIAAGFEPRDLAEMLAEMKAKSVADGGEALVIGADQTLELDDGSLLSKPGSREEALAQLRRLSDATHYLHSAAVAVERGERVWGETESVALDVRPLSDDFLQAYLDAEYEAVRFNVGGYRVEGMGAQLFEVDRRQPFRRARPAAPSTARLPSRARRGAKLMGIPYAEVIGDPIAHSKSPAIHKFWLDKLGIDGDYRAAQVPKGQLGDYFEARRTDSDWRGCSVTSPHKQSVIPLLNQRDDYGIGAVNCVVPRNGLFGTNTDIAGIGEALSFGVDTSAPVCIIGGGGAAKAVIAELDAAAVFQFNVLVRDKQQGVALIGPGAEYCRTFCFDEAKAALSGCVGVINASPLGMTGFPAMPDRVLDSLKGVRRGRFLRQGGFALDLVYSPLETAFLARARQEKLRVIDGLTVLIGQAASAFELFFGAPAPRGHDSQLRELLTP